ncbi:MAG TPA: hypothetical protein VGP79_00930 [Bryobacteraceae bacterium]|jgi:hypothetical protein|nr:hypothetical protein [Bryobacteraceae bacterium]
MPRVVILLFLCGLAGFAETIKLYLKDGTFQLVREYQVQPDRVRYYSTERSDWEEIPKELVDLDRTKKEAAEREVVVREEAKAQEEEDKAERQMKQEIAAVPQDPGAYYLHGDKLDPLKEAEAKVVTDKKRSVLKVLSPIPIVSGKGTLEVDGESALFKITEDRPEFYFRLATEERFGIIKLTPKKGARVVEKLAIIPVSNEVVEEQIEIETFKKQVGELVFKIWPTKPLEPGEYALIEFTPVEISGKSISVRAWDFSVGGAKLKGK